MPLATFEIISSNSPADKQVQGECTLKHKLQGLVTAQAGKSGKEIQEVKSQQAEVRHRRAKRIRSEGTRHKGRDHASRRNRQNGEVG